MTAFAQDPAKLLPEAYNTVFENEYVRVQRVYYAPRVKLPEHEHALWGTAYVYLNDAGPVKFGHIGLAYGAVTRPAVKAGSFRLYKAVKEIHTVESLSDEPSDFLRVEFKTATDKDPNTLRGKYFRLDVPPNQNAQQVQFENEQVRITRLLCTPGKACSFALSEKEPSLFVAFHDVQYKTSAGNVVKILAGYPQWIATGKGGPRMAGWIAGKDGAEWLRFDFKTAPLKAAETAAPHNHEHEASREAGRAAKKAEASALLKRAAALEAAGKLDESIAAHEQSLALDADLVQAHINLVALYGRTRQSAKAETHYQQALAINPELPDLHYNYGVLLVAQERIREAAAAFAQCLKFNPYYAEAHFNYAALIEQDGKLDEAATHYRKAIANKAGYRAAHFGLGRILVNQDKLAEAIEQFQQTLKPEDADTPRYLYALGATYIRAGERAKGIEHLRKALTQATALGQTSLAQSIERDLQVLAK